MSLTLENHDLAVDDRFRIKDAGNSNYDREFTVLAVEDILAQRIAE